jgi:hypothetical protein
MREGEMSDYSWEIKYKAEAVRAQRKELRRLELVLAADVPGSEGAQGRLEEAQEHLEEAARALDASLAGLPEMEVEV